MAKRAAAPKAAEPTPEVSNDDVLVAVRRVEKLLKAIADDIVTISEDIDTITITIPKAQLPPNDGPAPPEPPPAEEMSPDAQSQAARNAAA